MSRPFLSRSIEWKRRGRLLAESVEEQLSNVEAAVQQHSRHTTAPLSMREQFAATRNRQFKSSFNLLSPQTPIVRPP
jgi:hypothetical protein